MCFSFKMIVTLRVALLVIFIDFCLSKDVVVFPEKINDFALYNTNLFAIPTPLPADQVVAQALVEEGKTTKYYFLT